MPPIPGDDHQMAILVYCPARWDFSILAQVSRSATVRLNTGLPSCIRIEGAKITVVFELISALQHRLQQRRLQLAAGQNFERARVSDSR